MVDQAWAGSGNPRGGPAEPSESRPPSVCFLRGRRPGAVSFIRPRPLGVRYVLVSGLQVLILVALPAWCGEKGISISVQGAPGLFPPRGPELL